MLISISHRFVFVATLKTASTAIETKLRPHAEITINQSQFGKHLTISEIADRFARLFEEASLSEFFVFAVMRDPVDFILSMYNSHCHPDFATDPDLFTGNRSFSEFLEEWMASNAEQVRPQHERLLRKNGQIGVDYVISYENLRQGLETVAQWIGIGPIKDLPVENKSFGKLRRGDLRKEHLDWIQRTYRQDMTFREQFCDRLLDPSKQMRLWRCPALSPSLGC
jgi:hypothetical protein